MDLDQLSSADFAHRLMRTPDENITTAVTAWIATVMDASARRQFTRLWRTRLQWNCLPNDMWLLIWQCVTQEEFWCNAACVNRQCATLARTCSPAVLQHKTCLTIACHSAEMVDTISTFNGQLQSLHISDTRSLPEAQDTEKYSAQWSMWLSEVRSLDLRCYNTPFLSSYLALWSRMPHLRVLKIDFHTSFLASFELTHMTVQQQESCLRAFHHLEELSLKYRTLRQDTYQWLSAWVALPRLRALHLDQANMQTSVSLVFTRINANIQALEFPWLYDREIRALNLPRFAELRSLTVHNVYTRGMHEWNLEPLTHLQTLDVPNVYPYDYWENAERCAFTQVLTHLRLDVTCSTPYVTDALYRLRQLMQMCTGLKTLLLNFRSRGQEGDQMHGPDEVACVKVPWRTIASVPPLLVGSSSLRHIRIWDSYLSAYLPDDLLRQVLLLFAHCTDLDELSVQRRGEDRLSWWTSDMSGCFLTNRIGLLGGLFQDRYAAPRFFQLMHQGTESAGSLIPSAAVMQDE